MTPVIDARADDDGIRFTRRFAAPAEQVFHAWTDAASFARWFGGPQVDVPLDRLTWMPPPGGEWSAVMVLPDGNEIPWAGSIHEATSPSRLVFDLTDDDEADRDVVTVEIEADGDGGAVVRFSQLGASMPAAAYAQAMEGWLGFMDAMAEIVER